MTVAGAFEISAASSEGFEEAMREGIERPNENLRNIEGVWVKDMNVINRCCQREWPEREGL